MNQTEDRQVGEETNSTNSTYNRASRRLAKKAMRKSINGISHEKLTNDALDKLLETLRKYGNSPSQEQIEALYELLGTYTLMAQKVTQGRIAFPMATGLGKTQSIVAWVSTLYQRGVKHISLAVCASKVEALCDLKRDLIEAGVPEDHIGLLHSYQFDQSKADLYMADKAPLPPGYASLPCNSEGSRNGGSDHQILLVTHNRVRGNGDITRFNLYKGKPRDLLIWDESLITSDSRAVRRADLESAVGWLKPKNQEAHKPVIEYFEKVIQTLLKETSGVIKVPPLSPSKAKDFKDALGSHVVVEPLKQFLDICHNDLRVVQLPGNDGVITYDIAVPKALKNIVILDASHTIRELIHLDSSIDQSRFSEGIISYHNVTVHHLKYASGRGSMTEEFRARNRDGRKVSQEIVEVIKGIPDNEGIILFTFKKRTGEPDFQQILWEDLRAQKIDVEQLLPDGRPRFVWLTWGSETSISRHSYCSNVIFAGVLHRSDIDIASAMAGQADDLHMDLPPAKVRSVIKSEAAHCLYQAMSRGSCRVVKGRSTKPMKVWLIHKDIDIQERLHKVMPGLRWTEWVPEKIPPKGKIQEVASRIRNFLAELPGSLERMSTRQLKEEAGLKDIENRLFTRALNEVCDHGGLWNLVGRSVERIFKFSD